MAFALQLQDSLRDRHSQIVFEFAAGESLETVLGRHLLAVESTADTQLLTSILLLDEGGKHLWHGAAPSLPKSYCDAIDGAEIGATAGSCGTAAYLGQAVYVTDVATDPLWQDYRHLALEHGLRACWSTPIRGSGGAMLGTFAVYHLTPRGPTAEEVEAIQMITGHVAQAIEWAHGWDDARHLDLDGGARKAGKARLKLVSDNPATTLGDIGEEQDFLTQLDSYAANFERYAEMVKSPDLSDALKAVARDCRDLVVVFRRVEDFEGQ